MKRNGKTSLLLGCSSQEQERTHNLSFRGGILHFGAYEFRASDLRRRIHLWVDISPFSWGFTSSCKDEERKERKKIRKLKKKKKEASLKLSR